MAPNGGSSVNYESHPLIPVFGELLYVAARVSVLAYPLLALHAIEPLAKTSPSSRRMSLVPADWRSLGRTPPDPAASRSRHSRPHGIADHPWLGSAGASASTTASRATSTASMCVTINPRREQTLDLRKRCRRNSRAVRLPKLAIRLRPQLFDPLVGSTAASHGHSRLAA